MPEQTQDRVQLATYADVKKVVKATSWAWPGWLPRGHVSVLAGQTGIGKSQAAIDIIRMSLAGGKWPDGSPCEKLDAVMIVDTEGCQSVVTERLEKAGIPLDKVLLPFKPEHALSDILLNKPEHWARFEAAVRSSKVKLVVIDSMRGSHQGKEDGSDDMTLLMGKLQRLARDLDIAILVVHHLKKHQGMGRGRVTVDDVRGSGAICANARAVLCVEPVDLTDEYGTRAFRVLKSNLAAIPKALAFDIHESGIEWVEYPERQRTQSKLDEAVHFVRLTLKCGPVLSSEFSRLAYVAGIKESTLDDAKKAAGADKYKEPGSRGRWYWHMPKGTV